MNELMPKELDTMNLWRVGLKIRIQLIKQYVQWIKDSKKVKKDKL